MQDIIKAFNAKIAEQNLKQKDIAVLIDVPEDRLSRILNAKSKMLATEMLRLGYILNVDLNKYRATA